VNLVELVEAGPVLGDGAMGTMLQQRGLRLGDAPDRLNLEHPDIVTEIHCAYREAGAQFLKTNTFGANRLKLAAHGLEARIGEIIRRGVDLARQAGADACLVAGSVGPTGRLLEPYGDTPADDMHSAFAETGEAMQAAGVDFFLVETMTDINEAVIAISAIKAVSGRPIVATAVFSGGARGYRNMMGTPAGEGAGRMIEAGARFVGTNCCSGMDEARRIMEAMRTGSPAALVAQPNAGLPSIQAGSLVYPEGPEVMAKGVAPLLDLGIRIIGGCCGTTPLHIRAIGTAMGRV
jgi:methionine synthase I (cobalamin-dependent)